VRMRVDREGKRKFRFYNNKNTVFKGKSVLGLWVIFMFFLVVFSISLISEIYKCCICKQKLMLININLYWYIQMTTTYCLSISDLQTCRKSMSHTKGNVQLYEKLWLIFRQRSGTMSTCQTSKSSNVTLVC
jgi:ABC-type microcin C transport system permease subunit YejE